MCVLNNILVAYDGSEHSFRAAKFAAGVAGIVPGSRCTLLTVLTFTREEARFLGATAGEFEKAEQALETKIFSDVKNHYRNLNIPLVTEIREGDPAKEILTYAETYGIDHIIIGSRGLGNIKGTLLGSVSSKVIHTAKCPVTVINDKMHVPPENV